METDDFAAASDYLGIEGYRPQFQRGVDAIARSHGPRLLDLVGRDLNRSRLVWDAESGEWVADAPVVLEFTGAQLEVQHNKFDELSLTWGRIDTARPVDFLDSDWGWRDGALERLVALEGRTVLDVELLEWRGGDMADGSVAVSLIFGAGDRLTIFNALDENGVEFDTPPPAYRSCRLAG